MDTGLLPRSWQRTAISWTGWPLDQQAVMQIGKRNFFADSNGGLAQETANNWQV
jgi:hypothetical protein